jgi:hypothetical protein
LLENVSSHDTCLLLSLRKPNKKIRIMASLERLEIPYFHDVMLDNGTVALYLYLKRREKELKSEHQLDYKFELSDSQLIIESERLFDLLEEVYYMMGKETYDTYTDKQMAEAGNLYFFEDESNTLKHKRFPKMNTYGLTELLTNNAQGVTRVETNTIKIAEIEKSDSQKAQAIKEAFEKEKIKILSKIYFNKPYTKITRLEKPEMGYFTEGKYKCSLTGGNYKKVVNDQCISPFVSGITNFNSHLSTSDKRISWLAMYLCRFAPATCFYAYENKLRERLMVYLFHHSTLTGLAELWESSRLPQIKNIDDLRHIDNEFTRNFQVLSSLKKYNGDFQLTNDNLFSILYTFDKMAINKANTFEEDPLSEYDVPNNYSIISIKVDQYASTMRPNRTEIIDNVEPLIQLIRLMEEPIEGERSIYWTDILRDLLFIKASLAINKKARRFEREFREIILGKIFKIRSILTDMADFMVDCYAQTLDGEGRFRKYSNLVEFVKRYENLINMEEEKSKSRDAAINLGTQIGFNILNWSKSDGGKIDQKQNARQGRKYIVLLRKARTYEKFIEAITRIQGRFQFPINKDGFIETVSEENFKEFRDFAILQATNILVSEFSKKSDIQNTTNND